MHTRGFTLIELLVVIAIIGLLSSIVLASLNTARSKGSDAAIQSDLQAIRTQAELYALSNNNTYGSNAAATNSCSQAGTIFADPTIAKAVAGIQSAGSVVANLRCNVAARGSAWAMSASLVSNSALHWCVDSTGASKSQGVPLGASPPQTACP